MAIDPGSARGGAGVHIGRISRAGALRLTALASVVVVMLLAVTAPARAQQGDVRVQLSAASITIEETVRLAIVATGLDGELDSSALDREFDVVGRSSSRDVLNLDGRRTSTVTWVLELVPRAVGVFTVPAVSVDGVESELLTLTVSDAPTGAKRDLFVEASVDKSEPWVQSQVILTLKVFRAVDIVDGALGQPLGEGLDVRALGGERRYEDERDGRRYLVDERRYALFPQRSGELEIDPITLSVTVPADPARVRGFFSPTRKLVRRTAPIPLAVQERPADGGGWWLPATDVALEDAWRGNARGDPTRAGGEARVGEPLTRTLTLRANGVLDTQLPDISAPDVEGIATYADDPVRESEPTERGLAATQTVSFALIPERAGSFELPPVSLDWFDVATGRVRTASLPARTLTVLPAERAPSGTQPPGGSAAAPASTVGALREQDAGNRGAEPGGSDPAAIVPPREGTSNGGVASRWRTLAIVALIGWALTAAVLVYAWLARRSTANGMNGTSPAPTGAAVAASVDAREARRRVERAARDGDAEALARAVLERAAARWRDDPPRGLPELARRMPSEVDLVEELRALDAALYGRADARVTGLRPAFDTFPARLESALARSEATVVRSGPSPPGAQLPSL